MHAITWVLHCPSSYSSSSTARRQSSFTTSAWRPGSRHGTRLHSIRAAVGGGVGGFGSRVQLAKVARDSTRQIYSHGLIIAFELLEGSRLRGLIAIDGLAKLLDAAIDVGKLAELVLLLGENAGLQLDHGLGIGQLLLCPARSLILDFDTRRHAPPDDTGSGGHKHQNADNLGEQLVLDRNHATTPPHAVNMASRSP